MQQAELCEILPELKAKVEYFKVFGTAQPSQEQIKRMKHIQETREFNLKLKAEQERKRSYLQRVNEARAYNLGLRFKQQLQRQEQQDIKLLEMVRLNPMVLSSMR